MLPTKFKSLCCMLLIVVAEGAFAAGETPVSQGLQYITSAMYGATGITIATISVMIVGILCLSHFLKWSVLGYTIMGISIIFGSSSIVQGILSLVKH